MNPAEAIRATVIIPTFGDARFSKWAIRSVQEQTVGDIEIFIICDGSPSHMVSFFQAIADEDPRIKIRSFPKSKRTGEPYRDTIIQEEASGKNIFYCSHDDLWFPNHIAELEKQLESHPFAHSVYASIVLDTNPFGPKELPIVFLFGDLEREETRRMMLDDRKPRNLFGLTYGSHTKEAYLQLDEGWTTTPEGASTDLYMWQKFLRKFKANCITHKKVTAVNFPAPPRKEWSEQMREEELASYFQKIMDSRFRKKINRLAVLKIPDLPRTLIDKITWKLGLFRKRWG